jgi:hypothetical protein
MNAAMSSRLKRFFLGQKRTTAMGVGRGRGRPQTGKFPLDFTMYIIGEEFMRGPN